MDSDDETQSEDSGYPESATDAAKTQPAVVHVSRGLGCCDLICLRRDAQDSEPGDMDGGMVWHAKVPAHNSATKEQSPWQAGLHR